MIKSTDCILVMGRRGCGKSYLAKNLQNIFPRKIILDTLNEYNEGIIVYSFHEFCNAIKNLKNNNTDNFTLIYKFDPESQSSEVEFDHVMRICYYFGNVQVVIEEVQIFSSPHTLPHWLRQCLLVGRHQNISLLFTTQRPGELNKTIISQCAHIFCGQIVEGNDVRYVASFLNEDSKKLSTLKPRSFLYFSDEGIRQVTNDFKT